MSSPVGEKRPRSPDKLNEIRSGDSTATSANLPSPDTAASILSTHASPEAFEQEHVHAVYNVIAPHFSATRYKPWPRVKAFVEKCTSEAASRTQSRLQIGTSKTTELPYGVLVADVGCGNGKNLCIHNLTSAYGIGCDRSVELMMASMLGARRTRKVELVPMEEKKQTEGAKEDVQPDEASSSLTATSADKPNENQKGKKKKMQLKVSTGVEVPEALQRGLEMVGSDGIATGLRGSIFDIVISIAVIHHFSTFERRVAAVRELLRLCVPETGRVLIYAWAKEQAKDRGAGVDVFVPWALPIKYADRQQQLQAGEKNNEESVATSAPPVLQRYYHLFVKGELEEVCLAVNDDTHAQEDRVVRCKIEESYYDQENWCVVLSRPVN